MLLKIMFVWMIIMMNVMMNVMYECDDECTSLILLNANENGDWSF